MHTRSQHQVCSLLSGEVHAHAQALALAHAHMQAGTGTGTGTQAYSLFMMPEVDSVTSLNFVNTNDTDWCVGATVGMSATSTMMPSVCQNTETTFSQAMALVEKILSRPFAMSIAAGTRMSQPRLC